MSVKNLGVSFINDLNTGVFEIDLTSKPEKLSENLNLHRFKVCGTLFVSSMVGMKGMYDHHVILVDDYTWLLRYPQVYVPKMNFRRSACVFTTLIV